VVAEVWERAVKKSSDPFTSKGMFLLMKHWNQDLWATNFLRMMEMETFLLASGETSGLPNRNLNRLHSLRAQLTAALGAHSNFGWPKRKPSGRKRLQLVGRTRSGLTRGRRS
jgi:hypothetical protein